MSEEEKNIESGNADGEMPKEGMEKTLPLQPLEQPKGQDISSNNEASEITIMEVHKHPHHVMHKKKWAEYLLEFFMLFLAVFLGFVAENAREHNVEHKRAKTYAANLYEELKKDTASINIAIADNILMTSKLDTFCLYSAEKEKLNISNGMLYYYAIYSTYLSVYTSDNTTIEELKSSGNLRIMGNEISEKINVYLKLLSELENEYALTKIEFGKIEELYFKIFNGYATQLLIGGNKPLSRDSIFKLNIPLINDDPKIMQEFTGWQKFEIDIYQTQIKKFLLPIKQRATEILTLIKQEYHLENE